MDKKIQILIIMLIIFIGIKVDAENYDMTLSTTIPYVEKNGTVDIYVTLENISEIPDGLNACWFNLDYDSNKIIINKINGNSIIGENNWNVEEGENIVMDSSDSVKTKTIIGKISAKVLDDSVITIKNIQCSDANKDYNTNTSSLSLNLKAEQVESTSQNNQSNGTVESPETGIKEFSITFVLILIITLIFKKNISKKDLFKKI